MAVKVGRNDAVAVSTPVDMTPRSGASVLTGEWTVAHNRCLGCASAFGADGEDVIAGDEDVVGDLDELAGGGVLDVLGGAGSQLLGRKRELGRLAAVVLDDDDPPLV